MSAPSTEPEVLGPDQESEVERASQALTFRNAGRTWRQIAEALHVSVYQAKKDVQRALRALSDEAPEDRIARQQGVLNDINRAQYVAMLQGDKEAAQLIIRAMEHEAKLHGLYAPVRVAVGVSDVEFAEQAATLIKAMGVTIEETIPGVDVADLVPEDQLASAVGEAPDIATTTGQLAVERDRRWVEGP